MLSGNALGTVISLARGIVKLAGRLDVLMAERAGVEVHRSAAPAEGLHRHVVPVRTAAQ